MLLLVFGGIFSSTFASATPTSISRNCSVGGELGFVDNGCHQTFEQARDSVQSAPTHSWKLVGECRNSPPGTCDPPMVCEEVPGTTLYALFRDGVLFSHVCLGANQVEALFEVTGDMALYAFKRLEWPAPTMTISPPGGRIFVNLPAIFSTSLSGSRTQTVTLLGQRVVIEATPQAYTWHAGDGTDWTTGDPGTPYSPGADVSALNTHTYASATSVSPSVDVTYGGRFRVNSGGWQNIPGTLTVAGPTAALTVIEGRGQLTGND